MRHFSGEFQGLRLLMGDELDAIAGGDGEDTDDVQTDPNDEEIVVTGRTITMIPNPALLLPPITYTMPEDPDPNTGGQFQVLGDDCPTARNELQEALSTLRIGSPTAAAIIAAAEQSYMRIELTRSATPADAVIQYNDGSKTVSWDPFVAVGGVNSNGTTYSISPTMALAHELVHWSIPGAGDSEATVMRLANEIAREMNAYYGTGTFDTSRDVYGSTSKIFVKDANNDDRKWNLGDTRPGCSG